MSNRNHGTERAIHSHEHVHEDGTTHDHLHSHDGDSLHAARDVNHMHSAARSGGRMVIRRGAAGAKTDQLAAMYRQMGDEVRIAASATDEDEPVALMYAGEDMGLTAPSVVDGSLVELCGPADTEGAEVELAARIRDGVSLLADDNLAGELHRYSAMHQADQLRAAGHRVPEGFEGMI